MRPPADDPAVGKVQPAFDELGRMSFAEHSLESVLHKVTELASRVLPGRPITSVTVVQDGRPTTVASSGELAVTLDGEQYRLRSGPCLSAATTGRPSEIADTRAATEWAEFAAIAAEQGCKSVLSFPMPAPEGVAGALNVYASQFSVSDEETRAIAARFAAYAVVPVSNMYLYQSAVERARNLQNALDSRAGIDQAKGILMERFKLTPDQAFQVLARVSMVTNTKVREVADRFVATGELPTG
jgi:GAF domain-containing protein